MNSKLILVCAGLCLTQWTSPLLAQWQNSCDEPLMGNLGGGDTEKVSPCLLKEDSLGAIYPNPLVGKYQENSVSNPYGAGSPYKPNGLMNPYSEYGSRYSNKSWTNPYATEAPKLYDSEGNYRGKLSSNRYDPDSTSNPYGQYGSKYSLESINNPYGLGSRYNTQPIYVLPDNDDGASDE